MIFLTPTATRRPAHAPLLDVTLPALARVVPQARHLVCAFAGAYGVEGAQLDRVAIAVTEAVTNSVRYAYPDREDGTVRVRAVIAGHALEVFVQDSGDGVRSDNPTEGGLGQGFALIALSTSRFAIDQDPELGVEVWMRFELDETAGP